MSTPGSDRSGVSLILGLGSLKYRSQRRFQFIDAGSLAGQEFVEFITGRILLNGARQMVRRMFDKYGARVLVVDEMPPVLVHTSRPGLHLFEFERVTVASCHVSIFQD